MCAAAALLSVAGAYALPPSAAWPLQNTVNSAVAINVARALQLPALPSVLAALAGLALYDGIGTLAAPAAAAADAASVVTEDRMGESVSTSVSAPLLELIFAANRSMKYRHKSA